MMSPRNGWKKMTNSIKIFDYLEEIDAFFPTREYLEFARNTVLNSEWTPVVWLGRLVMMDCDHGEHIFDNWDLRDLYRKKYQDFDFTILNKYEGLNQYWNGPVSSEIIDELLIVNPTRFISHHYRSCNSADLRKQFWTDIFKSMRLSRKFLEAKVKDLTKKGFGVDE